MRPAIEAMTTTTNDDDDDDDDVRRDEAEGRVLSINGDRPAGFATLSIYIYQSFEGVACVKRSRSSSLFDRKERKK